MKVPKLEKAESGKQEERYCDAWEPFYSWAHYSAEVFSSGHIFWQLLLATTLKDVQMSAGINSFGRKEDPQYEMHGHPSATRLWQALAYFKNQLINGHDETRLWPL